VKSRKTVFTLAARADVFSLSGCSAVMSFLEPSDILSASRISDTWHAAGSLPSSWRHRLNDLARSLEVKLICKALMNIQRLIVGDTVVRRKEKKKVLKKTGKTMSLAASTPCPMSLAVQSQPDRRLFFDF
jgi:hypothetical protein